MKLSEMKTSRTVREEVLRSDPELAGEWHRTALGREVASTLVGYRAENGLTQEDLARRLGMQQPAIARLEDGEHNPSIATLQRVADVLGLGFDIAVRPHEVVQLAMGQRTGQSRHVYRRIASASTVGTAIAAAGFTTANAIMPVNAPLMERWSAVNDWLPMTQSTHEDFARPAPTSRTKRPAGIPAPAA